MCSKFNAIITIGTTVKIVEGRTKKPNNEQLSKIKLKNVSIPAVTAGGKSGRLIQLKTALITVKKTFNNNSIININFPLYLYEYSFYIEKPFH